MKTGIIPMTQSGAILGIPGQYKSPPFLFTSKGERGSVTLYDFVRKKPVIPDNPSEIPEDFGNDSLVIVPYVVKPFVFYCDSIEWDGNIDNMDKSGDGTQENPWKNINYALYQLKCILEESCDYIQLKVSGIMNYVINISEYFGTYIYGKKRLIISWDNIQIEYHGGWLVTGVQEAHFIDFNTEINLSIKSFYGFSGENLYFYNANIKIIDTFDDYDWNRTIEIFHCPYSNFYNCDITSSVKQGDYIRIFNYCSYSNFCNIEFDLFHGKAFNECNNSYFYDIDIYGDLQIEGEYFTGIYPVCEDCDYSVFYNCKCKKNYSVSLLNKSSDSRIFSYCENSVFINCSSENSISSLDNSLDTRVLLCAFCYCNSSIFYQCEVKFDGMVFSDDHSYIVFTGYKNDNAQYYSCECTLNAETESIFPSNGYFLSAISYASAYGFISYGKNTIFHNCKSFISCISHVSYMADGFYGPPGNPQQCDANSIAYAFQYSPNSGDVVSACNSTLSVSASADYSSFVEGSKYEEKCDLFNLDEKVCEGENQ